MKNRKRLPEHTSQQLAEAVVFPVSLTPARQKEASRQLAAARKKKQQEMTDNDRLSLKIYQFRFQLEDYISNKNFDPDLTFGHFLKQYVDLLDMKRKEFADDISIDETLLSQFINLHRLPPDYIAVRLEIHSNSAIPATYWFMLVEKQKEFELRTDKEIRRKESKFVHRRLAVRFDNNYLKQAVFTPGSMSSINK